MKNNMPTTPNDDLQDYFTDVEHLRDAFKNSVESMELSKRLFVIHGVGGAGKSSLLQMFRLYCKTSHCPVAFVSGDDGKSALAILSSWADDLKVNKVPLPSFGKSLEYYRVILAKVDKQAKKGGTLSSIAENAASKTAETVGGMLAGAAIGSIVPGIGTVVGGTLGGVLGGMGAEAMVDWLHQFLRKSDIDLLLDPEKKLTEDFITDIAKFARKKRLVLMLDTFEKITTLSDWVRDLVQRLHPNVLMIIAGRAIPDWNRMWPTWMAQAQIDEIKPMTEDVMRTLVGRYYAKIRGGEPDPRQVETIIRFAHGLPIVVTGAVQLWVEHSIEDFPSVKIGIVANLVDRLMEGVPKEFIPILEAAAVVRWFDESILRLITEQTDIHDAYNELRRFPFVKPRSEGFAVHDTVREILDENLRANDSDRHRKLHERAAQYFQKQIEDSVGQENDQFGLEFLYHQVRANEDVGIQLFQERAETLVRYRRISQLRILLADVASYSLKFQHSSLWQEYYVARLAHLEAKGINAEKKYRNIIENTAVDRKLQAYALCDLGEIILRLYGKESEAVTVLEKSFSLVELDSKLVTGLMLLSSALRRLGKLGQALIALEKAKNFFVQNEDKFGYIYTLSRLKAFYLDQGNPTEATRYFKLALENLSSFEFEPTSLRIEVLEGHGVFWSFYGQFADTEKKLRQAMDLVRQLDLQQYATRDIAYLAGLQEKYTEAEELFRTALDRDLSLDGNASKLGSAITLSSRGDILRRQGKLEEAYKEITASLKIMIEFGNPFGLPDVYLHLANLQSVMANDSKSKRQYLLAAEASYEKLYEYRWTGRRYVECNALIGLIGVRYAKGDYATVPSLLSEAQAIAQQFEYNDHLASLHLNKGHIIWNTSIPELGKGFDTVLHNYQHSIIYALRFNRFLLDEVLSGRNQGTPLNPIIPHCLKHGEEGQHMLNALRNWWRIGTNDIGKLRLDTISPLPEGMALIEAEKIARHREPGNDSPQKSVMEQLEAALSL